MLPNRLLSLCVAATLLLPVGRGFAQQDPSNFTEEFRQAIGAASTNFQLKKYDETLKALDQADKISPNSQISLLLRGAVYTQQKDYPKATDYFEQARKIDPKQFPPQFNLAEVVFVQKRYKEAREAFLKLQETFPKNELVQFKIFLTYLLEKNDVEAKKCLDAFKFPSDSPAYYFAHAAWGFAHDDLKTAQSYIQSSLGIFPQQQNEIFIESISDLGWITRNPAPAPAQ